AGLADQHTGRGTGGVGGPAPTGGHGAGRHGGEPRRASGGRARLRLGRHPGTVLAPGLHSAARGTGRCGRTVGGGLPRHARPPRPAARSPLYLRPVASPRRGGHSATRAANRVTSSSTSIRLVSLNTSCRAPGKIRAVKSSPARDSIPTLVSSTGTRRSSEPCTHNSGKEPMLPAVSPRSISVARALTVARLNGPCQTSSSAL